MTRTQQLERFLFSAKSAENGNARISNVELAVVLDGLSRALSSSNPAVARAAAQLLAGELEVSSNPLKPKDY